MNATKKSLVIVESPAKARTLARILGDAYELKASMGHIRDLPRSQLGVDVDNLFSPRYVVPREKSRLVRELKAAAKDVSAIYLATDPDREGEAISWHLSEMIGADSKKFRRVVFHEITEDAIEQAFKHPRVIDMDLVNAQQGRRILDRLVGYKISPLLWRKVRRGLSAGRVQSVALRIVVDREREISGFVSAEYWSIEAELSKKGETESPPFRALLVGHLNGSKPGLHNAEEADSLKNRLEKAAYAVLKVKARTANRQPPPPFITSTMQQEAWRKLRFTAEQTMAIAQQLYEGLNLGDQGSVGLITYMRTDSTHVARPALAEARDFIGKRYGEEYVPDHARTSGTVKGAQEAHEAIRPTRIHREPLQIRQYLTPNQFRLYDLVWKRMVASQMAAAVFDIVTVDIEARCLEPRSNYVFRTSSSVNRFQGFILVYTEGKDTDEEEKESRLPPLEDGDPLNLLTLIPEQHFTQPPPRYTEATLIKTLEQFGIGRPSTYAPTISTIRDREYVGKVDGSLKPTELGMIVTDLLARYFPDIVDVQFTARMENELDEVAEQKRGWVSAVQDFYTPFQISLDKASAEMETVRLPEETVDETCPKCGKPMAVKVGRFGRFIACTGYPDCKFTMSFQAKTGVKCPKCGTGDLLQRVNKKKRTFYGCSKYPQCDFAMNAKPLPDPCPKCGSLVTAYRDKWAKCTKCDYRGKLPAA